MSFFANKFVIVALWSLAFAVAKILLQRRVPHMQDLASAGMYFLLAEWFALLTEGLAFDARHFIVLLLFVLMVALRLALAKRASIK